ncbi:2-oxo acid dehydrogenase subunit E2 [Roseivivax sp.]
MTEITPITLPKWGLEMSEGTVTGWHLSEGDSAEKGAELVDVETDKIVNVVELDRPGTLRRILVQPGDTVPVGTLIAVMADPAVEDAAVEGFIREYSPVDASFDPDEGASEPKAEAPAEAPAAEAPPATETRATPLARRAADRAGVDLAAVPGSGRGGKVLQKDVSGAATPRDPEAVRAENAAIPASVIARKFANGLGLSLAGIAGTGRKGRVSLEDAQEAARAAGLWSPPAPKAAPAGQAAPEAAAGQEQPFTGMRKSISAALTRSKQNIPHFYTTVDIEVSALLDLRAAMNTAAEEGAPKLSVNDFLLRACGLALARHPEVNVHVSETGVTAFEQVDIAMAVAVEGGLVTPVLRDVAGRGLRALAAEARDQAARARDRSLTSADLAGGTFTLSNLGMFGVREFDAIINPPQAAILAVGGPRREPRETAEGIAFTSVISVTLSADHRAVDGALAAQFLATLKALIEAPARLLS